MNVYHKFTKIKALIFDIDGVLTNSQVLSTEEGNLLRTTHTSDGYAMKRAIQSGFEVMIISKGKSKGTLSRFKNLGLKEIHLDVKNKLDTYADIKSRYQLSDEEILYMGNDISDIGVLKLAGVAACPFDANVDVRNVCNYISQYNGGEICVREIIERILRLNGKW